MVITGTRLAAPDMLPDGQSIPPKRPRVSAYQGSSVNGHDRALVISALREGASRNGVRSFLAPASPNDLGGQPWVDVTLTAAELRARKELTEGPQVPLSIDKGVETTINRLTSRKEQLLTAAELAAVGGSGSKAGIQLLTQHEVQALGTLTEAERHLVRRWINTRNAMFPYAVVLPDDCDSVIYLAKAADEQTPGLTAEQVVRTTPFPDGHPHLQTHLLRFRSVLEATLSHNERRPWWTLHRPRTNVVGDASPDAEGWAPFCVTDRWGPGGRLIAGVAPAYTAPASGLHVLRVADGSLPAAYLAAIYNSTLYQEMATTLPPGNYERTTWRDWACPGVRGRQRKSCVMLSGSQSL